MAKDNKAFAKVPIHMISAYVHENHAVFAQFKMEETPNEITAIPRLLEMREFNDATVMIDVRGCQKEIAKRLFGD